ncbi:MAG: LysR family transcriptional regulator [Anaeromyxobacteraceae bacterium]
MNLEHLAAFERIVREGGFGRAALALGVQQSTVSARVQALEAEVGGALFTRGRRVTLTALGEALLPHARRALEIVGEGLDAARLAQTGHRGKVRLAALGSLAGGLVGPAVAAFLRERPEVDLTVRSGHHELVVEHLVDGLAELGILVWPARRPRPSSSRRSSPSGRRSPSWWGRGTRSRAGGR